MEPLVGFVLVVFIGIAAGAIVARSGRQAPSSARLAFVTPALVGIAGAFLGLHGAILSGFYGGAAFTGSAVGAVAVVGLWRLMARTP